MRYTTRKANSEDAQSMDRIQNEAFGPASGFTPYSRELRRSNVSYILAVRPMTGEEERAARRESRARLRVLRRFFSNRLGRKRKPSLEGETRDHISGFVGVWTSVGQSHIVVIAVRPGERRRGVGELLIIESLKEAQRQGARNATLEVRKSNGAARALYRKYGFVDAGIRHKYYADNGEDAVIMTTPAIDDIKFSKMFEKRVASYEHTANARVQLGRT